MEDDRSTLPTPKRTPWNKGKLIGAKPPLLARHSLRPAKSAPIIYSMAVALRAVIRWVSGN